MNPFEMEPLDRLCQVCDKRKPDVRYVRDPYLWDVHREEKWMDLCEDCLDTRLGDI